MTSGTSQRFWKCFKNLPTEIQDRTRNKFSLWQDNPQHSSLHFKKVSTNQPLWSVRITQSYRVLGIREGDYIEWFWIGPHDEYERIIGNA